MVILQTITLLFSISLIGYFILLLVFIYGNRIPAPVLKPGPPFSPIVSVVVAIRNGAAALPQLISDLSLQLTDYPLEFILVDDKSSDGTDQLIAECCRKDTRFKAANSKDGDSRLAHKKRALAAGIDLARGNVLLFTDADCRLSPHWVSSMAGAMQKGGEYIVGYALPRPGNSLASQYQKLDFFMLMLGARAMVHMEHPWACTGQNQGYRMELYRKGDGFIPLAHYLQGDDSLFLQHLRSIATFQTVFLNDYEGRVTGRPEITWRGLLHQRLRWAGDANAMWRHNHWFFIAILCTFLANSGLALLLPVALYWTSLLPLWLLFFGLKLVLEGVLYWTGNRVFTEKLTWSAFLIWSLIQPFYILTMGLGSFFAPRFGWRTR